MKAISPKHLAFMIDKGFLMIESTFYAIRRPPVEYYERMEPEEIQRVERVRVMGGKIGLPLLGMMKHVAGHFPYRAVESKVTPEWLLRRGREKFPKLMGVIEGRGEAGQRWLQEQCRELVQFATGRLVWSDEKETLIPVEPGVIL